MPINKKKAQEILQEIHRLAKPFGSGGTAPATPPPTDTPPADNVITLKEPVVITDDRKTTPSGNEGHYYKPTAPKPTGGGGYGGNTNVITMQYALQDLAKAVAEQYLNLQEAFSEDPRTRNQAKSRDAFGVFLAKNYMRNSQVPGIEYDPSEKVTEVADKEKSATDPTRLSVVMDTMNRVGHPKKGERFADGNWGPRTNAAIRNAYAFASGLFDFVNDVNRFATKKLDIKSYNPSRLNDLAKYAQVDPKALSPIQKLQAAPEVTKHVKDIKSMYEEVKNNILQHKAYQQFIEGDRAFKSYAKVTPQQINAVKKQFPQGINVTVGGVPTNIKVEDLLSKKALEEWIDRAIPNAKQQGKATPEIVISSLWKQYEKLIGTPDMGY